MSLSRFHDFGVALSEAIASDMLADGCSIAEQVNLCSKIHRWSERTLTRRLYSSSLLTIYHNLICSDYGATFDEWIASVGMHGRRESQQRAFMVGYIVGWSTLKGNQWHQESSDGRSDTRSPIA